MRILECFQISYPPPHRRVSRRQLPRVVLTSHDAALDSCFAAIGLFAFPTSCYLRIGRGEVIVLNSESRDLPFFPPVWYFLFHRDRQPSSVCEYGDILGSCTRVNFLFPRREKRIQCKVLWICSAEKGKGSFSSEHSTRILKVWRSSNVMPVTRWRNHRGFAWGGAVTSRTLLRRSRSSAKRRTSWMSRWHVKGRASRPTRCFFLPAVLFSKLSWRCVTHPYLFWENPYYRIVSNTTKPFTLVKYNIWVNALHITATS